MNLLRKTKAQLIELIEEKDKLISELENKASTQEPQQLTTKEHINEAISGVKSITLKRKLERILRAV